MNQNSLNLNDLMKDIQENSITLEKTLEMVKVIDSKAEEIKNTIDKDLIISVYTKLASFLLDHGIRARDSQRDQIFTMIRKIFYRSDHVNISETKSFLLKGYYYLYQNDFDKAKDHFDNAYLLNNNSLSYWFGKGLIEYHKNNFKKALENFKIIYQNFRKSFPEVYYLMAVCFFRLKNFSMAEQSLKMLLKKDYSEKGKIYSALSIIYLIKQQYNEYYEMVQNVVKIELEKQKDITDLNALTSLSEHYLYKGDFKKADKLAQKALNIFEQNPEIIDSQQNRQTNEYLQDSKSRMYYVLGQVYHATDKNGEYEEAEKFYNKAIKSMQYNYPAQYGLGQIYFKKKLYKESSQCFEFIINKLKENQSQECYLILPHLYMRLNKKKETVSCFEKALRYFPENMALKIQYCTFLETYNTKKAFELYQPLIQNLDDSSEYYSIELLNNISLVLAENGEIKKALYFNKKCQEMIEEKNYESEEEKLSIKGTVQFNESYIHLQNNNETKALKCLFVLKTEQKFFIDAYVQIAHIYYLQNQFSKMIHMFNQALFIAQKCNTVFRADDVFFSYLHHLLLTQNYHQALQFIQKVRVDDFYYFLVKATIYYYNVVSSRDQEQEAKSYIKASAEICRKILVHQNNNLCASNLVGALLAERGRLDDTEYIYGKMQDCLEKGHPYMYNIALVEFFKKNYGKSLIILESPKSSLSIQRSTLYPLVLTAIKEFEKAELKWKYNIKRNPELQSFYYFSAFLHEKAQKYFKKKSKNILRLKKMVKELSFCLGSFQIIFKLISTEDTKQLSKELNKEQIRKRRMKMLRYQCDQQMFFLKQNMDNYQKIIFEEEHNTRQQKQSKIDRKKILEEKIVKEQREKEEQEKKRKMNEEEMERKAQAIMTGLDEFQIEWGAKKQKEKEKKSKVEKMIDEQEQNRKKREKEGRRKMKKISKGDEELNLKNEDVDSSSDDSYDPNNIQEKEIDFNNYDSESEKEEKIKPQEEKSEPQFFQKTKRTKLMVDDEDDY